MLCAQTWVRWLLTILLLLAVPSAGAAEQWHQHEIIRTFWCEPPADDAHLAVLKKEHFSLTWCPADALDKVARHGLRAMIHDETILKPWMLDDPGKRKMLDDLIDKVKNHPALDGYWLADEPLNEAEVKKIGPLARYIRQKDPAHFTYVNAVPNFALGGAAYEKYLDTYFRELQPQILSFDYYPLHQNFDMISYFDNLETLRRHTNAHNVPWISIIQASKFEPDWRLPTPSELRWLVYVNLAYGAKGISYFTYWGPKKFNGLYADGVRMPLMDTVTQLNAEMESLSKVLLPLRCESVYHTAPLPPGTHAIPKDCPFQIDRGHGQFMIAQFINPKTKQKHLMVINRDYRSAHEVRLKLIGASLTAEFDRRNSTFISAPAVDWSGSARFSLPAGDAKIFAVEH
jgi:hypothetical protein